MGLLVLPESAPRMDLELEAAYTHLVSRDVSEGALERANAAFPFSEYLIPHKWVGCALRMHGYLRFAVKCLVKMTCCSLSCVSGI